MMKIGTTLLTHGLVLSPMAGVTDRSMRRVCAMQGAEYAVTEMVSAKALVYEQQSHASVPVKTGDLCRLDGDIPTAVQIFGAEPEFLAEAARLISTGTWRGFSGVLPAAVDINMGCPVRKVVTCGEGSALMRNPEKIYGIVRAVCAASSLPVTVKLRSGWDAGSINAPECARAAESAGAAAVCVHARTREQFYSPGIDLRVIARVRDAVGIPVIGNGDITCAADARNMIEETGCDGIAVGRGALGNPFIFAEIKAACEGRGYTPPTPRQICDTALLQLEMAVADKGERRGSAEVKTTLARYIHGRPGSAAAREKIVTAPDSAAIAAAINGFFAR